MEALITTKCALKRFVEPRHACLGALRGFQPLPVLERQLVLDSSDIFHQHRMGSRCDAAPHVVQTFSEALQSHRAALISLSVPAILVDGLPRSCEPLKCRGKNGERTERGPFGHHGAEHSCRAPDAIAATTTDQAAIL